MAADMDKEKLALIGQIEVAIDRLVILQSALIDLPMGGNPLESNDYLDARGNASLQVGAVMGQLSNLDEAAGG